MAIAEDLIALAEYVYADNACLSEPELQDAFCDAEGVCHWGVCQESGCVIDKYHRGLALQTACLASGIAARSDETRNAAQPEGQEPGGEAETPNPPANPSAQEDTPNA